MNHNTLQYRTESSAPWSLGDRSPIVTFQCDQGGALAFVLSHLSKAHYDNNLVRLWWGDEVIEITGPEALAFFKDFVRADATWVHSDGKQIVSVRHRVAADIDAEGIG
jgi:hypothetical protein